MWGYSHRAKNALRKVPNSRFTPDRKFARFPTTPGNVGRHGRESIILPPIRITEYARIRGVSDDAVRKAIKTGRLKNCIVLVKNKPWIGDVILANREWDMNTNDKHCRKDALPPMTAPLPPGPARAKANREPSPDTRLRVYPNDLDDPGSIDPTTGFPLQSVSRARREHFDAALAEAKAGALAGSLVNREEVTRSAFNVAREVRDALFLIKDRLADELATMTDPNAISKLLDTEFRNALVKLAEELTLDSPLLS